MNEIFKIIDEMNKLELQIDKGNIEKLRLYEAKREELKGLLQERVDNSPIILNHMIIEEAYKTVLLLEKCMGKEDW